MYNDTVTWLLNTRNAAVQYRAKTELLGLAAEPTETLMWIEKKLPADWYKIKGLWYVYYINALAECGLNQSMLPSEWFEAAVEKIRTSFDFGCEAFMLLQAMVVAKIPKSRKYLICYVPTGCLTVGFSVKDEETS